MPDANDTTLHFVHISDTHIHHDPAYNLPGIANIPMVGADALVSAINSLPFTPDFVLHTGDVAYDPDPLAYERARAILGQIKFPVYYLAGNHDDPETLQRVMLGTDAVLAPFEYDFALKGVQVVVVDSNRPCQQPAGLVSAAQLERLTRLCAADDPRPLVVAVHHNVLPNGTPWWDDFMRMSNGEAFHAALLPARHRLRGVFHGHVHQPVDTYRDGILYSGVVSSWYQLHDYPGQNSIEVDSNIAPGFNVVTITPTQTFIRRHSVIV